MQTPKVGSTLSAESKFRSEQFLFEEFNHRGVVTMGSHGSDTFLGNMGLHAKRLSRVTAWVPLVLSLHFGVRGTPVFWGFGATMGIHAS